MHFALFIATAGRFSPSISSQRRHGVRRDADEDTTALARNVQIGRWLSPPREAM